MRERERERERINERKRERESVCEREKERERCELIKQREISDKRREIHKGCEERK